MEERQTPEHKKQPYVRQPGSPTRDRYFTRGTTLRRHPTGRSRNPGLVPQHPYEPAIHHQTATSSGATPTAPSAARISSR